MYFILGKKLQLRCIPVGGRLEESIKNDSEVQKMIYETMIKRITFFSLGKRKLKT